VSRIEENGKKSLKRPKLLTKGSSAHGIRGCKGLALVYKNIEKTCYKILSYIKEMS
jgi:hypothetical protein